MSLDKRGNMEDKSVLLVEDNTGDELLTLRAFKRAGIKNKIIVARDGAEALAYLLGASSNEERNGFLMPQVVLLDLYLPKLDGAEVLKRLRSDERTASRLIVVLTFTRQQQDVPDSYKLDADGYICKPVDHAQLTDTARKLNLNWMVEHDT